MDVATPEVPAVPQPMAPAPVAAPPAAVPGEGVAEDNSSLYVGDLDKDVQETHLFEVFSGIGPVHSIRVCRDTVTRRSLGYAYVNYNNTIDPEAAKTAKESLNYKEINGKPIRIMWANRNPTARKSKEGNIFIKNLERDVTTRLLHDTFISFGPILSCKVALDKDGKSKGYGFVHFENAESAKAAIKEVDNMRLGESDKIVRVSEFLSRTERGDAARQFTNLYVKNLPESVKTKDQLQDLFSEHGTISSIVIMLDPKTERNFGFVNYEKPEAAAAAKEAMHDKELEGRKLFVSRAQTKTERSEFLKRRYEQRRTQLAQQWEGKNVYVKNLASEVDEAMLKEAFSAFGEIVNTKIMRDSDSKVSRGFGFVCFADGEAAQKAVAEKNNAELNGKKLYVAFAQPKAVRAQQMQDMMKSNMVPQMMPYAGGRMNPMNPMNPAMQGMANMGFMPQYPGMMQYQNGSRQMMGGMMGPMGFQMPGGNNRNMPGGRGGNAANPMLNMQMMQMGGMMGPGMMGPGGMMPGAMGGQRGGRSGRGGGRGGRGAPNGPASGRMPGFAGAAGRGAPGASRGAAGRGPGGRPDQMPGQPEAEESNLAAKLAGMGEDDQKQHLGELLFPRIESMLSQRFSENNANKIASKVTGMFLEMDTAGLLYLLDTDQECSVKIDEALEVLRMHNAMPEGCE